jgi:uncharacterized protein with PQ loop repeat
MRCKMMADYVKGFIEISFSIALFINAALFVPQSIKLWRTKGAKDFSILTFGGFNLIQIVAVAYGYIKNDNLLTIGFLLSFVTCGSITMQIIFYKLRNIKFRHFVS